MSETSKTSTHPPMMGYADLVRTAEKLIADERGRRLFLARARAKRRDEAQKRGVSESEIPWGIAFIRRPDSWLPFERDMAIARGRKLARERGWKDIVP